MWSRCMELGPLGSSVAFSRKYLGISKSLMDCFVCCFSHFLLPFRLLLWCRRVRDSVAVLLGAMQSWVAVFTYTWSPCATLYCATRAALGVWGLTTWLHELFWALSFTFFFNMWNRQSLWKFWLLSCLTIYKPSDPQSCSVFRNADWKRHLPVGLFFSVLTSHHPVEAADLSKRSLAWALFKVVGSLGRLLQGKGEAHSLYI